MPRLAPLAFRRQLRRRSADAERGFWSALRDRRFDSAKFRRQYGLGPYVLDFYCPWLRIAIEADGGQHFTDEGRARDLAREAYLRLRGVRILRFTDREILVETKRVLESIWAVISRERAAPSPRPSPPLGERG